MKNFCKAVKDYHQAKKEMQYLNPTPNLRLCYSQKDGYFTSIYFSEEYIKKQGLEVVHG